ncbi:MAG TPA: DNA recombination protein RmuC, partial [Dongiaceae bacterium]
TTREETDRMRDEAAARGQALREEVSRNLIGFNESLLKLLNELGGRLDDRFSTFGSETGQNSKALRDEVATTLQRLGEELRETVGTLVKLQSEKLDAVGMQMNALSQTNDNRYGTLQELVQQQLTQFRIDLTNGTKSLGEEIAGSLKRFSEQFLAGITKLGESQSEKLAGMAGQITTLTETTEKKQEALRLSVEQRLDQLRQDNEAKLEQMRVTVDEKLQGALEKRLGESFALVSKRLEEVHKGLGEMQSLANGVGDLKRVLTNVKVRGGWGEVRLSALLEQILTPDQYVQNARCRPDSQEVVEYAIKLPGRDVDGEEVLLPIDAKFPQEDYERLVDASERGDTEDVETALKQLEARVKFEGKQLSEKYINPPRTTDFAIMFFPTEGLYAEVLRRPGLADQLQHSHHILVTGPTTLAALLNSLQMGFRTLTIQKRSSEVWRVLSAVRTEFGKYGELVDKVKKKLNEASNVIDTVSVRGRAISRHLRDVATLEPSEATSILALSDVATGSEDEPIKLDS